MLGSHRTGKAYYHPWTCSLRIDHETSRKYEGVIHNMSPAENGGVKSLTLVNYHSVRLCGVHFVHFRLTMHL